MRALLIAEKPDLMRKIEACYKANRDKIPYDATFVSQRGHLVTLKLPNELDESLKDWSWDTLPIVPEDHGGWQYKIIEEKKSGNFMTPKERYDQIKKELTSGKYDFVIHAGDPDQEGELLVRSVLDHMKNRLPVKRFWTNDLTESHILDALINLRDDDNDPMLKNLLAAAYGRQHSDYRFGMNGSRAASLQMDARVAVGRVKTWIQAMVCRRAEEIRKFTPKTFYGVQAHYEEGFTGTLFNGVSAGLSGTKEGEEEEGVVWFETEDEAKDLISGLGKKLEVVSFEGTRQKSYAPKLFKLATAQIEAGKMGYSAADTLRILQKLYERKYLSYPRTDCEYLGGDEAFNAMIRAAASVPFLAPFANDIGESDIARVKKTKTWVNAKALQDAGHSALVPTGVVPDWDSLEKEEKDIYGMVCRQFLAPFMPPLVQDKSELVARSKDRLFRSTGTTLVSEGWIKVFGRSHRDREIPPHEEGDILAVNEYDIARKTTECPKRYSTADLIAVCENPLKFLNDRALRRLGKRLKIGTPATRANIIEELIITDKYLKKVREGKREVVIPTAVGEEIIENLADCDICKADLTGEWEEKLEKVRSGLLSLEELEEDMKRDVASLVEDIRGRKMRPLSVESKYQELGTCPMCGKKLMHGPNMFYCTGYEKGCKVGGYREKYGAKITDDEFLSMIKGETIKKQMKKGEITWEQEIACDRDTLRIIYPGMEKQSGYACPVCKKPVIELPYAYRCKGYTDGTCGVYITKFFPQKTVEKERFEELFTKGESGEIDGLISQKTGKPYSAKMVVDTAERKIVLKFVNRDEGTGLVCPVCGKKIVSRGFLFACSGTSNGSCEFTMYNLENGKKMPEERAKAYLDAVKDGRVGGGAHAYMTNGDVSTRWTCPGCGKKLMRNGTKVHCTACRFTFYRVMASHILTDEEIGTVTAKKKTDTIKDFISRKGDRFPARVFYSKEKNQLTYDFQDESEKSPYICPICGKRMMQDRAFVTCECGLRVWKKPGNRLLSEKDLEDLFTKGRTEYIQMLSKNTKRPYLARLVINKEQKKVDFEYK